ncbi:MAG: hypothetical protein KDB27_17840 [Planctomycetales bacterium]|nr:hypothetical protein [Planctomycetales bacterium]
MVRTTVVGIYAVFGVAAFGLVLAIIGLARYHSLRFWQQPDVPTSQVPRSVDRDPSSTAAPSDGVERERFDLETDFLNFVDEIDSKLMNGQDEA